MASQEGESDGGPGVDQEEDNTAEKLKMKSESLEIAMETLKLKDEILQITEEKLKIQSESLEIAMEALKLKDELIARLEARMSEKDLAVDKLTGELQTLKNGQSARVARWCWIILALVVVGSVLEFTGGHLPKSLDATSVGGDIILYAMGMLYAILFWQRPATSLWRRPRNRGRARSVPSLEADDQ